MNLSRSGLGGPRCALRKFMHDHQSWA